MSERCERGIWRGYKGSSKHERGVRKRGAKERNEENEGSFRAGDTIEHFGKKSIASSMGEN